MSTCTVSGDRLTFQHRHWVLGVILLVMLGIPGLGLLWLTTFGWFLVDHPKAGMRVTFFAIGVVFLVVSLLITLYRSSVVLDRRQHVILRARGFWGRVTADVCRIGEDTMVFISKVVRQANDTTYEAFLVHIGANSNLVKLTECGSYAKAREGAENVVRFLGISLVDASQSDVCIRSAETIDSSLLDRARPNLDAVTDLRCAEGIEVDASEEKVVLDIGRVARPGLAMAKSLGLGVVSCAAAVGAFMWGPGAVGVLTALAGLILGSLGVFCLIAPFLGGFLGTRVVLRSDSVGVRADAIGRCVKSRIPLDQVEEVLAGSSGSVLFRGDAYGATIGNLSSTHAAWLLKALRAVYEPERSSHTTN